MPANRPAGTPGRAGSSTLAGLPHPLGADLALKSSAARGKGIVGNVFVYVDRLGVLPQVIEARESSATVAHEWSLASVFSCTV